MKPTPDQYDTGRFIRLPEPPYCVAIFSSLHPANDDEYPHTVACMLQLAAVQPGFLSVESARDTEDFGIPPSCWRDEASIAVCKAQAEHRFAQTHGRQRWYEHDEVRIARIERTCRRRS